jgi:hypothetical protein
MPEDGILDCFPLREHLYIISNFIIVLLAYVVAVTQKLL